MRTKSVKCYTDVHEYASFLKSDLGIPDTSDEGECVIVKLAECTLPHHGNTWFAPPSEFVHLDGFDGEGTFGLTSLEAERMVDGNGCLLIDTQRTRIATEWEIEHSELLARAALCETLARAAPDADVTVEMRERMKRLALAVAAESGVNPARLTKTLETLIEVASEMTHQRKVADEIMRELGDAVEVREPETAKTHAADLARSAN
jgi:hypothetical protein